MFLRQFVFWFLTPVKQVTLTAHTLKSYSLSQIIEQKISKSCNNSSLIRTLRKFKNSFWYFIVFDHNKSFCTKLFEILVPRKIVFVYGTFVWHLSLWQFVLYLLYIIIKLRRSKIINENVYNKQVELWTIFFKYYNV